MFALAVLCTQVLVLDHVRVVDVVRGETSAPTRVVVEEDRITSVGAREVPAGAEVLDLSGCTVLPGLMDLHSHLLLRPYDEMPWNDQVLKESQGLRTIRGVVSAERTLRHGFTLLRELGTEGAGFADVDLKDAIDQGLVPGPRLQVSTLAIVATGCYGPMGFDPRFSLPKGAQEADGVDGVRKAVREQVAAGADWIKVYADYRRHPGAPSTPTFSLEELEALVDEARSAGLPVAAHASTDEGARRAVLAGVRTIEHGTEVGDAVFAAMAERGTVLCPTLNAVASMARYAGWNGEEPLPRRVAAARDSFQRARAAGVTIACGSDVGVFAHGDNLAELEWMHAFGMTRAEAIAAATVVAAAVIGRSADLGRVEPGRLADLVVVRGDPLDDLAVLREPVEVLIGGRRVLHGRREN